MKPNSRYADLGGNTESEFNSLLALEKRICPATQIEFIPTRSNQIYISRDAQIKYNNIQAKLRYRELKKMNDALKVNAKKLKKLYTYMIENDLNYLPKELFEFENFDFKISTHNAINTLTGIIVHWIFEYGFEPVDETLNFYFLHKKQSV